VCGVVMRSRGRREVRLIDTPCFGRSVELNWRKRTWRCAEPSCEAGVLTEQDDSVARPRALLTARACWGRSGRFGGSMPRSSGWRGSSERPGALCGAPSNRCSKRWLRRSPVSTACTRSGSMSTCGITSRPSPSRTVVAGRRSSPGWSIFPVTAREERALGSWTWSLAAPARAYAEWLKERNETFRAGIKVATRDPFQGYQNALDDELEDAIAVLDAFHVGKLGTAALDEVRRRVQQETLGHRGRKGDPLYGIQNVLRCGAERPTDKQKARLAKAIDADERHDEVHIAWQCAQQLRAAYTADHLAEGKKTAEQVLATSRPARSPRSSGSARPSSDGAKRSGPTSTPAGPTTAGPKPSTASSSSTAASPEASATATTTGYACCSSAAASATPTCKKSRQSARADQTGG
jgi:transposase